MTNQHIEPFHLTDNDANLTPGDGVASTWSDIWKYQVPRGSQLILSAGDQFAAYLEDASAEVGNRTCRIKIEIRDPAEGEAQLIYGPKHYQHSKEFQDDDLKASLTDLKPISVPARYWLVISAYDDGAVDASDSSFDLYIHRSRAGIV